MKTYINEQKKECIVTLTDLKVIDEWTKVIDLKPLKKVLEALETLGKNVEGIYIQYVYINLDKPYYRRFAEELTDKIWLEVSKYRTEQKVIYKNNRLYFIAEETEIICPDDMHDSHSDYDKPELTVIIRWN